MYRMYGMSRCQDDRSDNVQDVRYVAMSGRQGATMYRPFNIALCQIDNERINQQLSTQQSSYDYQ